MQTRKQREVNSRFDEHTVSLVGYTNAGKSTLMNRLTGSDVLVKDQLFSTLDTRTRQWRLAELGPRCCYSDTVGFIRDLPHHLIASFKATLEEARQAGGCCSAMSSMPAISTRRSTSSPSRRCSRTSNADDRPTLLVLSKIDRLKDLSYLPWVLQAHHPRAVAVSAKTGQGLDELRDAVIEMISADFAQVTIDVDATNGEIAGVLAAHAEIYRQEIPRQPHPHVRLDAARHLVQHITEPDVEITRQVPPAGGAGH